ncbi:class I SAM-dependent methyltransferase [Pseudomonas protegens]|uniref:class I SAM-dependent methyltransferase n=1 Tax=Pseudomonas protegens TaxID=380021 RepID=UPI002024D237|nr:class I SAM-dependent methyltransferase [Pseudomonas protegens]MCL9658397.1 class I SAM-dependent methyltransferase [Pseudomonas protegens]
MLLESVQGPGDQAVALPVLGCQDCGHIFQQYRFDEAFYNAYYDKFYRLSLFGNTEPERAFFLDQVRRGEHLYQHLQDVLPAKGKMLDVGCSAGGLMIPFAKRGWTVRGNDPDRAYVEYGKNIGLDIDLVGAEHMSPTGDYNLIIINGSLEHVHDVNQVMQLCRQASAEDGLLLIEGRALGYGIKQGFLTHNHRRYLSASSIEHLMYRHGWEPIQTTHEPVCGPTRPGAVFVLGRACAQPATEHLESIKAQGRKALQESYMPSLHSMRPRT